MKKLVIYLDTSVINHLFAADAPDLQAATIEFFENFVSSRRYEIFVSTIVVDEIMKTNNPNKRQVLLDVISKYQLDILIFDNERLEVMDLAKHYIQNGIIPEKKAEDALHIAIATVYEMDVLLSWNFKHMANINKEYAVHTVNFSMGYVKPLRLLTPFEVIGNE